MSDQMTDQLLELADRVVALAGDDVEAQVSVTRNRHGLTRFANSFIHQHVGEDTTSVALTVAVDGRVAGAASSDVSEEALAKLVASTVEAARLNPVDPRWAGLAPPADLAVGDRFDAATAAAEPDDRVTEVAAFVDADRDLLAAGYLDTSGIWAAFANSAGQRVVGRGSHATLDGIHQTPTSAGAGHTTSRRLADIDGADQGRRSVDVAHRSAEFEDIEPGEYEVVLAPEAAATLAQFVGVYGFNARAHLDGESFVELGTDQVDPAITLLDDPSDDASLGLPFDAEGTPKERTVLVDGGRMEALVHDRRTAAEAGARSTGNAMHGGAGFGAFAGDLVLAAGDTPADDLIADVERGLWVARFNYCRVLDPRNLVVTGLTRNGVFLIEDGRLTSAVGNLRFTQSFADAIAPGRVKGVGDDLRFADAEFGAGMVRAPSLHLAGWRFSGGARG